jgi:phospholipid/cholesterol/gamma-HCH transport system permease protein
MTGGSPAAVIDRVGAGSLRFFEEVGAIVVFGARALVEAVRPPYEPREVLQHLFEFACRSVPLVVLAGLAIGVVLSMHTRASLERFGAEAMFPAGLAIALVRETGPLITGLLASGRVGAGIGAIKVGDQIDALRSKCPPSVS